MVFARVALSFLSLLLALGLSNGASATEPCYEDVSCNPVEPGGYAILHPRPYDCTFLCSSYNETHRTYHSLPARIELRARARLASGTLFFQTRNFDFGDILALDATDEDVMNATIQSYFARWNACQRVALQMRLRYSCHP